MRTILFFIFITQSLISFSIQKKVPELHVCTVGVYPKESYHQHMHRLIDSCARYNLNLIHLGLNEKWIGNCSKITILKQFVDSLPDEDILLFTDACDVFYQARKQTILQRFFEYNSPLVFSAELNCYPDKSLASLYPRTSSPFKYLNAGGYIGYVREIRKMLDALSARFEKNYGGDDQILFTEFFLQNKKKYKLDSKCKIFISLHGLHLNAFKFNPVQQKIKSIVTNTYPCAFHGNGDLGKILFINLYDIIIKNRPN